MLDVLFFVFSGPWIFLGSLVLLAVAAFGVHGIVHIETTHIHGNVHHHAASDEEDDE